MNIKLFHIVFILILLIKTNIVYGVKLFPNFFQADFKQINHNTISKKKRESTGRMFYKKSDGMRLEVLYPKQDILTFVINNSKSWYYTPPFIPGEKGEVIIKKAKNIGTLILFKLLVEEIKNNKRYHVHNINKWTIKLIFSQKTKEKLGFKSIIIKGKKKEKIKSYKDISFIEVNYKSIGKKLLISFSKIKEISLPSKLFTFQVPENTNKVTY